MQLQIIQDELTNNAIPTLQHLVFQLTNLRTHLKGKNALNGPRNLALGFEEDRLQSLIDTTNGYLRQFEGLLVDLVRTKRELRNFFVFLNNQVLKIHNKKEDLKEEYNNSQDQPTEREEISNSRSDIAKLNANIQVLIQTLQQGDKYLLLHHVAKYFEQNENAQIDKQTEDPIAAIASLSSQS